MKTLTVNIKISKLNQNRMMVKNDLIQDNICFKIDGFIDNDKKIAYQSKRRDEQRQARKEKRQAR